MVLDDTLLFIRSQTDILLWDYYLVIITKSKYLVRDQTVFICDKYDN